FFFFLPSILLSGFMFPFRGMPVWAQWIGSCLPNTHFLRIVRGILLKGTGTVEILPELWPLLLFLAVAMTLGVKRYRQTLDRRGRRAWTAPAASAARPDPRGSTSAWGTRRRESVPRPLACRRDG